MMTRHILPVFFSLWFCGSLLIGLTTAAPAETDVTTLNPGRWSGGAGLGFMANTPDGPEFGMKGHADYFVMHRFSLGGLAQYAGVGNDFLFGLSAQAKYWWDIPGTEHLAKLVLQGGLGFVRAGIKDDDNGVAANTYGSFLIPLGVGVDYAVTPRLAVTADFLLNLTSLGDNVRVGGGTVDLHTNVMPACYLGVRF